LGIDRRRLPDRRAALLPGLGTLRIEIVRLRPSVGAELAWCRDGPEPPLLFPGLGVDRRQESARRAVAAGDAGVDDAVVVERRARDRVAVLPAGDLRLPERRAGFDIERDDVAVEVAEEHLAFADGDATVRPAAADRAYILVDPGFVLPDQCAGLSIE